MYIYCYWISSSCTWRTWLDYLHWLAECDPAYCTTLLHYLIPTGKHAAEKQKILLNVSLHDFLLKILQGIFNRVGSFFVSLIYKSVNNTKTYLINETLFFFHLLSYLCLFYFSIHLLFILLLSYQFFYWNLSNPLLAHEKLWSTYVHMWTYVHMSTPHNYF